MTGNGCPGPSSVLERETGFEPATLSLGSSRTQSVTRFSRRSRSQTPIITASRTVPIRRATSIPSQLAQRFPLLVLRRCCGLRRHRGAPQRRLGARMEARATCSPCAPWRPVWASPRPPSTRSWRRDRCSTSASPTPSGSPRLTWMPLWPARGQSDAPGNRSCPSGSGKLGPRSPQRAPRADDPDRLHRVIDPVEEVFPPGRQRTDLPTRRRGEPDLHLAARSSRTRSSAATDLPAAISSSACRSDE